MNGAQYPFRSDTADMPQIVFQHTLLDGNLCGRLEMLHGTPAANPETGTCRPNPHRRFVNQRNGLCKFPFAFSFQNLAPDCFSLQGVLDKDDLPGCAIFIG